MECSSCASSGDQRRNFGADDDDDDDDDDDGRSAEAVAKWRKTRGKRMVACSID